MSDLHDDKLDTGLRALFQAEQAPLPAEPFMGELQAKLRLEMLAALTLAEQRVRARLMVGVVAQAVLVIVLAVWLQPLFVAGEDSLNSLLASVPEPSILAEPKNHALLLLVTLLYALAVLWCFRFRVQRFLAPW